MFIYAGFIYNMVRNYKRTSSRGCYSRDAVQQAIDAIVKDGMSLKKASAVFGVPCTTLKRRITTSRVPNSLGRFSPS
jgi:hypothetical protein